LEPEITIVICTRDRAAQLASVLSSACRFSVPGGLVWEVCIVDNGSSDNTREVVEGFADRLPIRYIREDVAGLSNARNRGVAEARGRYICWTDDDVELDEGWLAAYASAFQRHPEAVVFGGRILPKLEAPSPRWFAAVADRWPLSPLLAARDFGDEVSPLSLEDGRVPWGANFAVRAAEQRALRYDPKLGVSPTQRRLGEESEIVFKLLRDGGSGWWVPDAKVRHIIPIRRQRRAYIYEYFFAMGETFAYLETVAPGANHMRPALSAPSPLAAGDAMLMLRRADAGLRYLILRLLGANLSGLHFLSQVGLLSGMLAYRRRFAALDAAASS
jgi:glycosyltransferase involved in cell wall biosynthesis